MIVYSEQVMKFECVRLRSCLCVPFSKSFSIIYELQFQSMKDFILSLFPFDFELQPTQNVVIFMLPELTSINCDGNYVLNTFSINLFT